MPPTTTARLAVARTLSRGSSMPARATGYKTSAPWSLARSTGWSASPAGASQIEPSEVYRLAIVGNSTMIHLLLGLPPEPIRLTPYITTANFPPSLRAHEIGLELNPQATVDCLPGVASYHGRRHHRRRAQLGDGPDREPDPVHGHRHQRRDGVRHGGMAGVVRLLGRAGLRRRRRRARHARHAGRHRRSVDQQRARLRADLPCHRQRAGQAASAARG